MKRFYSFSKHISHKKPPFINSQESLTKIVCTIGPACSNEETLTRMIQSGMNVARLNFSHGSHEYHLQSADMIRRIAQKLGTNTAILCDIQGPKIRMGVLDQDSIVLREGDIIRVTPKDIVGNKDRISVLIPTLLEDLVPGDFIFINDGIVTLKVVSCEEEDLVCEVKAGGPISAKKGCNIPSTKVKVDVLTDKDKDDLKFIASRLKPEFIAASFVGTASDIVSIRNELAKNSGEKIRIVAKIERPLALAHIEEIIKVSDAIMVARGDLGVEIPTHEVPIAQKEISKLSNIYGKPVIIATQMLESMTNSKRPTRAETADVFNAVVDGADAVMLSGETSVGKYPVETVQQMNTIAKAAIPYIPIRNPDDFDSPIQAVTETIGHTIFTLSKEFNEIKKTGKIVVMTESGYSARMVSKYRPVLPIIAIVGSPKVAKEMELVWGVKAIFDNRLLTLCKRNLYTSLVRQMCTSSLLAEDDIVILVHATNEGSNMNVVDVKKVMNNVPHENQTNVE